MTYLYSDDTKTLTSIPDQTTNMIVESFVEILGDYCTQNSQKTLTSVSFSTPSSLTKMLHCTFINCVLLKEVDFRSCTELVSCLSSNFYGCSSLEHVYFPTYFQTFDTSVFVGTSLKSFEFSQVAYRTGGLSFENVITLESVDFSKAVNIEYILDYCFKNTSIRVLDLRKCMKLKEIAKNAFQDCAQLEIIYLPCKSSLTISQYAFKNCTSLKNVFMPKCNSKPKIVASAFSDCNSLIIPSGIVNLQITCKPHKSSSIITISLYIFIICK